MLDEATSAVDPSTEVRLQRALDSLTRGRTSIAIAHRLSTAEAADEVVVVDAGRIVERGHHTELVALGGVYTRPTGPGPRSNGSCDSGTRRTRPGRRRRGHRKASPAAYI